MTSRVRRVARVAFFSLALAVAAAAGAYRTARASVFERLGRVGEQLLAYAGDASVGPARTVEINGIRLIFATGATGDPVDRVLDHYEELYRSRDGGLARRLAGSTPGGASSVVGRLDTDSEGFVAAIDLGPEELTSSEWAKRLSAYLDTGDIASLGSLTYVYARRRGDTTQIISIRSDGAFRPVDLFSKNGDAPGFDVPGVPLPPDSRRVFSAREIGTDWVAAIYATPGDPSGLQSIAGTSTSETSSMLLTTRRDGSGMLVAGRVDRR